MVPPLFAMPPPAVFAVIRIGIVLAIIAIGVFVTLTANRKGGAQSERTRRARLGLLAIICGPLFGAGFSAAINTFGGVHPLDVAYNYYVFTIIGGVAGLIVGIALAVTSVFAPGNIHESKPTTSLPHEPWSEL